MKSTIIITCMSIAILVGACNNPKMSNDQSAMTTDSTAVLALDTTKLAQGGVFYQCPMDKEQIAGKPGNCVKCGMALEKKVKN